MSQLQLVEGFEHLPSQQEIDEKKSRIFQNKLAGVDDIYTDWVLSGDYEPGVEGRFWQDLFENAVSAYETETGVPVTPEELQTIEKAIRADCKLLATHGFDEEIFTED